ncbi:MAG: hypothetical protein OXM88_12605 [bacterium]|nr:hypothetical protein [bacterium]
MRRVTVVVALMSVLVAVTACGDDPGAEPDTSAATVTTRATTPTTTPVVDTSSPASETQPTTTPTTEPFPSRDVLNYLQDMQGIAVRVGELVLDMRAANNDWDNRSESGVTYAQTEARLVDIEVRALALRDDIGLIEPPPDRGLPVEHQTAWVALGQMADAATDALAGLRSPDTGERRRAALAEFLVAYERFAGAFDRIVQIIGRGAEVSLPTTGTTVAETTTTTEAETTTTTGGDATTTTEAGTTTTTEGDTTTTTEADTTTTTEGDTGGQSSVPPAPDIEYQVVEEGDSSVEGAVRIWLTVQVEAGTTKSELGQLGERLGFEYRLSDEYQALAIYFVHFPEGIDTLGTWIHAPYGEWNRADEVDRGDYSEHQIGNHTVEKDWGLLPTDAQMNLYRRYLEYRDGQDGSVAEEELIAQAAAEFGVDVEEIDAAIAAWEAWLAG